MNQLIIELGNALTKGQTHLVALHKTDNDTLLLTIQLANPDDAKVTIPPVQVQGTVEEVAAQADAGLIAFFESAKRAITDTDAALAELKKESDAALKAARDAASARAKKPAGTPTKTASIALSVSPEMATTTITNRTTKAEQKLSGSSTIENLALGTYDVVTTAEGYDSLTATLTLAKENAVETHAATLAPSAPSLFA